MKFNFSLNGQIRPSLEEFRELARDRHVGGVEYDVVVVGPERRYADITPRDVTRDAGSGRASQVLDAAEAEVFRQRH